MNIIDIDCNFRYHYDFNFIIDYFKKLQHAENLKTIIKDLDFIKFFRDKTLEKRNYIPKIKFLKILNRKILKKDYSFFKNFDKNYIDFYEIPANIFDKKNRS